MAAKRKSWAQKWAEGVAKKDLPKVFDCPELGKRMVVPNPSEVEAIVKKVPEGKVITMAQIAEKLAKKHKADICCPMTTGIFAWIMSYASCEAQGIDVECNSDALPNFKKAHRGTPWWRVVKTTGELNAKYPFAPQLQKALLGMEKVKVVQKGKKFIVGT